VCTKVDLQLSWVRTRSEGSVSKRPSEKETTVPEGEPCPYCAYLAANPEELRQHLLHLHPEVEPEPDWWDRDAVEPPLLW
jgi:hypothetical protein